MCAECHSTGVRKNYDAANDRFATTFAEISVGCEACHGQGSRHVAWAREQAELVALRQDRRSGEGPAGSLRRAAAMSPGRSTRRPATPSAAPRPPRCARRSRHAGCATRAAANSPRIGSPADGCRTRIVVSPLSRGLYHADGQMLDEVYNYGSFKQSKMFAAGVTCSDCHEPHGAKLRLPAMASACTSRRGQVLARPNRGAWVAMCPLRLSRTAGVADRAGVAGRPCPRMACSPHASHARSAPPFPVRGLPTSVGAEPCVGARPNLRAAGLTGRLSRVTAIRNIHAGRGLLRATGPPLPLRVWGRVGQSRQGAPPPPPLPPDVRRINVLRFAQGDPPARRLRLRKRHPAPVAAQRPGRLPARRIIWIQSRWQDGVAARTAVQAGPCPR